MSHVQKHIEVGGKTLTFDTGKLAKQANGAVFISMNDTQILCTVVSTLTPKPGAGYFPLSCDYVEKFYAAGRVPGSYFKREARQAEHEIIASRIIDRPCRPLFPEGFMADTQVLATVTSYDKSADPQVLAVIGCSAALAISDIPWNGPVAACRVGRIDGVLVANPGHAERQTGDLELFVVVGPKGIVMVEAAAKFVTEAEMVEALLFAESTCKPIVEAIQALAAECGKTKFVFTPPAVDQDLVAACRELAYAGVQAACGIVTKAERYAAADAVKKATQAALKERFPDKGGDIAEILSGFKDELCRQQILQTGHRIDGRACDEVRAITIEPGILKRTHGSALFTRGETQTLCTVTLGTTSDEQRLETLNGQEMKRFLMHYNFPSFSTGEVKPNRGPGRREIGHGNLALKGLTPALPTFDMFPYMLRAVSEVLESNGSSSMATVCGTSMALMDAGVPISSAVAGVAMGLIQDDGKTAILTDILGDEDHFGDMDFKVVGNAQGISALQMDIKIDGLDRATMEAALEQARRGRLHILGCMNAVLPRERPDLSEFAPRIFTILINPERIRDLIGPGGKNIKSITAQTGASIDIEDDGTVRVAAIDGEVAEKTIALIRSFTTEAEIGKDYDGVVTRVAEFGAFVRIMPGTEGLVHISELSDERIERVEDVVKLGDEIKVRVVNVDRMGKIRLSHREALGLAPRPPREGGGDRGGRGGDRGGRGGFGGGGDRGGRGGFDRDRGGGGNGGGNGGGDRGGDRGGDNGASTAGERSPEALQRRERRERQV
ncbi:MAG: polyribonucleotide nucleotidyltransferase [Myxococcales bacterium]|nr:polyribonucleotide nucleotidyltransferase [Myxococcales bacterium]